MNTFVFSENGKWWFRWKRRAEDMIWLDCEEVFDTKEQAEEKRNDFVRSRTRYNEFVAIA
jgi:hypothetical protein